MSANAAFADTPRFEVIQISTANTAIDGTGTIEALFTAGESGSRLDAFGITARGTTTAGTIYAFTRKSDADPWRYFWAVQVPAVTKAVGTSAWAYSVNGLNWVLEAGAQVGFSTHNAEPFTIFTVTAGDF